MKTEQKLIEIESLIENLLKKHATGGLLKYKVLSFADQYENLSVSMIIEKLGIKKSNFALLASELERQGLLETALGWVSKNWEKDGNLEIRYIHKDNILPDKIEKTLFNIVKSSFSQRRKTIINSLNGTCGKSKIEIEKICELLNIDSRSRAENLSLEDFIKLAKHIVN